MVVARPRAADAIGVGTVITFQLASGQPEVATHRVVAVAQSAARALGPTTMACGISAKSEWALASLQDTLAAHLVTAFNGHSPPSLADVCATLTSRRQMYDYRVAVAANSLEDLAAKLRNAVPRHVANFPCSDPGAVFIFSGQGSQVSLHTFT